MPRSCQRLAKLCLVSLALLSGCAVVTKENAATFPDWELCVLYYKPTDLYSDWIYDDLENKTIMGELSKRGLADPKDCQLNELAKKRCLRDGYQEGTHELRQCQRAEETLITAQMSAKKQEIFQRKMAARPTNIEIQRNYFVW